MAQRTKTVEYVWETGTALRSTVTALAGTNFYTPAAISVIASETSGTRTIRDAELIITARDAETTTARRVDGCRIGVQIDAVAWSDLDLTGTGIANTGDPYTVHFSRDVTSYFVTNFTTATHMVGVRAEFETDVASNVNVITFKLRLTYEYDDSSPEFTKTVRIPLEGNTGFLSTTVNTNFRGSTGAAQIPALDTFLPEASKTYRQIWFEITATDGGAATTDFSASMKLSTWNFARTGPTLEQGLNGSSVYYDMYVLTPINLLGLDPGTDYSYTQDFQIWSSLASRFERMSVVMYVTYTYAKPTSGSVLNSVVVPFRATLERLPGTTTTDKLRTVVDFWIEEPATITMKQSAVFLSYFAQSSANIDVRVNSQGSTSSLYTTTTLLHSGMHSLQHRIDVAHGGTAVTLARGKNSITIDLFASVTTNVPNSFSGVLILNYESGVASGGEGSHNHTTWWKIWTTHEGVIAGDTYREVATTNQRTPNIPETAYWKNDASVELRMNFTGSSTASTVNLLAEIQSGELMGDGWAQYGFTPATDSEFGHGLHYLDPLKPTPPVWDDYANDLAARMDLETARKWRWNSSHVCQWSASLVLNYHAITFSSTRDITGSGGGTVNIDLYRADTDEKVAETSRTGNGTYTVTWYDNTLNYYTVAIEDATHTGRSANFTLGT